MRIWLGWMWYSGGVGAEEGDGGEGLVEGGGEGVWGEVVVDGESRGSLWRRGRWRACGSLTCCRCANCRRGCRRWRGKGPVPSGV